MALLDILGATEGGNFFSNAGKTAGTLETEAKAAIAEFAPAIAQRLKDKAAADPEAFESLLALLEDNSDAELSEAGALTGSEAISDGNAILKDVYGSPEAAHAAAAELAPASIDDPAIGVLNAISATAVLAALSSANVSTLAEGAAQVTTPAAGGGFLSVLIAALLKGLLQGASRQLAPKRRRRRYTSYYGRRTPVRRRRQRTPGLDDIFRDILGGSRR